MKNYYVYLQYINDVVVYIGITTTPYHRPYYFGERRNDHFKKLLLENLDAKFSVKVQGPFSESHARGLEKELIKLHGNGLCNVAFTSKAKMPFWGRNCPKKAEIDNYLKRNPVKYY
jgi:hypothetical protein